MFHGAKSREQNHSLYKMKVHSLDGKSVCEIPVSNQAVIFGNIQRLQRRPWNRQLKEKKIWLSDDGQGCPNKWMLTGEDICGLLFTGQMYKFKCGLVAVETILGWLIIGKVPGKKNQGVSTLAFHC